MNKIRMAVIGAGRIGKIHIQNLIGMPDVELKCVVDVRLDVLKAWAKDLEIERVSDNVNSAFEEDIDAVVISSPTNTHADLIIEAARKKKDIFCEKPIDKNLQKIEEALKEVKTAGVKLQVGFNRRFDHNFMKIKEFVDSGKIGDVHVVNITSRDPDLPSFEYLKSSGGIFVDMTIHDFDMARYLVGKEVEEVYAVGNVLIDPKVAQAEDYDTTISVLKFENGAFCTIDNSRKAVYGYDQRVEAFGTKGSALAFNDKPTNVVLSNENGVCEDKPLYFFLERYKESFEREMKEFVSCVREGKEPPVTGEDGLKAMAIAIAATKSAREKRVVRLEEVIER